MMLEQAFRSGQIINLLLLFVIIEALAIIFYWRKTASGIAPRFLLPTLGAGVCLMLALRAVLQQSTIMIPAFWLFISLLFHLADLRMRWVRNK